MKLADIFFPTRKVSIKGWNTYIAGVAGALVDPRLWSLGIAHPQGVPESS